MIVYLKTEEEIESFKKVGKETGRILDIIFNYIINNANCIPLDLDNIAREECKKIDGKPAFLGYRGFPAAICVSKNNVMVHGIPNDVPFKKGDVVSVDFGLDINGFIGDTADTIVVGEMQPGNKAIMLCRKALREAIKVAKNGNKLSDISSIIKNIAKKNGYETPENYGGHGIDVGNMHGMPFIPCSPNFEDDITLKSGMVLAIEPMLIDASSNSLTVAGDKWAVIAHGTTVHAEHTVLVTDSGGVMLT